MWMRAIVVALCAFSVAVLQTASADDKPAPKKVTGEEIPWAKVIVTGEIGGKGPGTSYAAVGMSSGRGIERTTWVGPTPTGPTGAKRLSADEVKPDCGFSIRSFRLAERVTVIVWMEADAEYLARVQKSDRPAEDKKPSADDERDQHLTATMLQSHKLWELQDGKEPARVVLEGRVAAGQKTTPVPSITATGRLAVVKLDRAKDWPEPGVAWIEGILERGKYEVGGGKTSTLAIRNGTTPIILTGKAADEAGELKGPVLAKGRLLIGSDRQLLLQVDELKPVNTLADDLKFLAGEKKAIWKLLGGDDSRIVPLVLQSDKKGRLAIRPAKKGLGAVCDFEFELMEKDGERAIRLKIPESKFEKGAEIDIRYTRDKNAFRISSGSVEREMFKAVFGGEIALKGEWQRLEE